LKYTQIKLCICVFLWVQTFCKALILLRNKGLIPATSVLELFFEMFRCQDKLLRKTLYTYVVNDIKNVNQHHKNAKLNTVSKILNYSTSSFIWHISKIQLTISIKKYLVTLLVLCNKRHTNDLLHSVFQYIMESLKSILLLLVHVCLIKSWFCCTSDTPKLHVHNVEGQQSCRSKNVTGGFSLKQHWNLNIIKNDKPLATACYPAGPQCLTFYISMHVNSINHNVTDNRSCSILIHSQVCL